MNLGKIIREELKKQGRSQRWLAGRIRMDEKTLSGKLTRDNLSAQELMMISYVLKIDLNKIKGRYTMPTSLDVIYESAKNNASYEEVKSIIEENMPELEDVGEILAALTICCVRKNVSHDMYLEFACAGTIGGCLEDSLNECYYFYENIKNEDDLCKYVHDEDLGEWIINLPHMFFEFGCLIFEKATIKSFVNDDKLFFED